jgi:mannosyltransferase
MGAAGPAFPAAQLVDPFNRATPIIVTFEEGPIGSVDSTTSESAVQSRTVGAPGPPPAKPSMLARHSDASLALVSAALAWVLAVVGSWNASLWTDEAATISAARRSLPELWAMVQNIDAVHGLYYLFMHFWVGLFGESAFWLRMPSALAIAAAAAGVFLVARALGGPALGLTAAAVFAVLPRITWAGMEARPYAFSAAAAVWLTIVLMVALRRRTTRWWLAYSGLAALSIGINLYLVFILASHALTVLALRRAGRRTFIAWSLAATLGVIISAPVVYLSAMERGQLNDDELGWSRWLRNVVVNQWFLGDTPTGGYPQTGAAGLWKISAVLLAGVCGLVMIYALQMILRTPGGGSKRGYLAWIVPQIALPTLVLGLYSLYVHPMYSPRYLTLSAPAVAVLIGAGMLRLRPAWLRGCVGISIVLLALPVYVSQREEHAKSGTDWSAVAGYIQEHKTANDAVYFSPRYPPVGDQVLLTLRRVAVAYPDAFAGLRDLTVDTTGAQDGTLDGTSRLLAASMTGLDDVDRIWVIRRLDYPVESARLDDDRLQAAGYQFRTAWSGPVNSIVEFYR